MGYVYAVLLKNVPKTSKLLSKKRKVINKNVWKGNRK